MNLINYNLSWGRKVVLIHDYFPLHVLQDLDAMITTDTWQAHPQPHRQCMSSRPGDTHLHLLNHTGAHVSTWVGRALVLSSWQLWRDTEGLTYARHTDARTFKPAEYHIQIYLGMGNAHMGTRFYNSMFTRKPTIQLSYTRNAGYFMSRPQNILHSVAPVPPGQCRLSVIARYTHA